MGLISFILSLVALLLTIIAFIPLLGWLNWIFIPVALLALVGNIIFYYVDLGMRKLALAGIIICLVAIVIGLLRLNLGGGII